MLLPLLHEWNVFLAARVIMGSPLHSRNPYTSLANIRRPVASATRRKTRYTALGTASMGSKCCRDSSSTRWPSRRKSTTRGKRTVATLLINFLETKRAVKTQNHWGSGLCPTSGILHNRKSQTQRLRLALSKRHKRVGVSLSSPEDENAHISRNVVFPSYFRIPDNGQRPYTLWFWVLYAIVKTL
jgi:hypothetical protein